MWNYSEKVREHFLNPRNVGVMEDADAIGEVGNIQCGDSLKLYLKVRDGRIADVTFQTYGCASAIASSSALTELVKGKTLEEALKITNEDIAEYLGGLPEEKMHCSVMGWEALEKAIAHYRGEVDALEKEQEGEIVCKCFGVTDKTIERVVRDNHLTTVEQVTNYSKAGGGCKKCHAEIQKIIDRVRGVAPTGKAAPEARARMTNIQLIRLIQDTIEREIRPALQADGGDIELVDVLGSRVLVALRGTCTGCPSAGLTLKGMVESKLREFVDETISVEEVRE